MTPSGSSRRLRWRTRIAGDAPRSPRAASWRGGGRCLGAHPGPVQLDLAQMRQERRPGNSPLRATFFGGLGRRIWLSAERSQIRSTTFSASFGGGSGASSSGAKHMQAEAAGRGRLRLSGARGRRTSRLACVSVLDKVELVPSRMVRTVSVLVLQTPTSALYHNILFC